MPRPKWPDPIQRAFFDAWIDEDDMPDGMRDQRTETFQMRWGALDSSAFQRALQEGDEADRLCALFTLGYLAPAGVEDLLVPFLSSPVRKERWASAIALGEGKDERAYFKSGIPGSFFAETWYHLQDELAYALGQLKAWNALDGLELPQMRFQLARMYVVFGSLELDLPPWYNGDIMKLINMGKIDLDSIVTILREHFGLTEYVSKGTLQLFQKWYWERAGR